MGGKKLDLKDLKILRELDMDARQPNSKIAKKVGLSKEVVNYRIKSLENRGIVERYYAILNTAKLGYMFCRFFMCFQNVDVEKEKEIMDYARKQPAIGWIVRTQGPWDLVFVIWAKNILDFNNTCDDICCKYVSYFKHKFVSIATNLHLFKYNYLYDTQDFSEHMVGRDFEQEKVDITDLKILELLTKNGRMPTLMIAKKLGLTPNAVKYRIKGMIRKKIIHGFRAALNINQLGYQRHKVLLVLQNMTKQRFNSLVEFLRCEPNVVYITEAVGQGDLEFEIDVKNNDQLYGTINKLRSEFSDILKDYQICLTLSEKEINYLPVKNNNSNS
ncbi:Lrp/AsnC family transcriptional regulator [Candidatus Woesearchaeota archaeon]|nr:Lrp/AsnC family transcriptional regulator [Candidatus Woesearchaeota archaeon]